jgi:hypothetical protein
MVGEKITHYPNGRVDLEVTLDRDDLELAKMYLSEKPTEWVSLVKQFRDSGRSFAEATSIVYLARKELGLLGGSDGVGLETE